MRRSLGVTLCALLALAGAAPAGFSPGGAVSPEGERATCDIPGARHIRNVGGSDGAGLCVFTSVQLAADWQNVRELDGFRKWMQARPGGGYPSKLERCISQFCAERGVKVPEYVQHTGGDVEFLKLALRTGRMPCVTYDGRDDFYSGQIAHMVNLAYLDDTSAAIVDNNRPGKWLWMTAKEFVSRWKGNSGGWAVVLLAPPPPPYAGPPPAFIAALGPNPVGNPPGPDFVWAFLPRVGWGWVQTDNPRPAAADNYGVAVEHLHEGPRWVLNGVETSREEVFSAFGADLADDSAKLALTVVGPKEATAAALAAYQQLPAADREKFRLQTYTPDRWEVERFNLGAGVSVRKGPARVGTELVKAAGEASAAALSAAVERALRGPLLPGPLSRDGRRALIAAGFLLVVALYFSLRSKP